MNDSAGWATLDIIPSVRDMRKRLEAQMSGDLDAAGRAGGQRLGDAMGDAAGSRITTSLRNAIGGAVAGASIVQAMRGIYSAAAEAEQSVGGVHAVFKDYADGVVADSQRASTELGLSANAYRELVTVSGAMLKNKGLTDFADQAANLVRVGADLAATYGGETTQAVEALNAAMRGESDPIERYGITLNETAVKAKAAAMGFTELEGAAGENAKTQARLALIMEQSADAQGMFASESGTAANEAQKLSASWQDMAARLGEQALPAITDTTTFLRDYAVPAVESSAGVVLSLAAAAGDLPGPVKAAAAAMVALKAASAFGLTDSIAAAGERGGRAVEALRRQVTLTTDAYRDARTVTHRFGDASVRVDSGVGRLSASMTAAQTAARGLGGGMRTALGGAVGMLGGPWGVALAGGTALLGAFWAEQQKAKALTDELTATLDAQTGAMTDNTRAVAVKQLQDSGALEASKALGISTALLTDAVLGQEEAVAQVSARWDELRAGDVDDETYRAMEKVTGAWRDIAPAIEESKSAWELSESAMESTSEAARDYGKELSDAEKELRNLIDSENERASSNINARRDEIGMLNELRDARKDLKAGAGIDINTEAGQANMLALLDLADQWLGMDERLRNEDGAYKKMRDDFLSVAEEMKVPKDEAKKLARELLSVPADAEVKFKSKGFDRLMTEINALKAALGEIPDAQIDWAAYGTGPQSPRMNDGASTGGRGLRATDPDPAPSGGGRQGITVIHNGDIRPADSREFYRDTQRRIQAAALGGRP